MHWNGFYFLVDGDKILGKIMDSNILCNNILYNIAEIIIIICFWGALIGGSGLCAWILVQPLFKKKHLKKNI